MKAPISLFSVPFYFSPFNLWYINDEFVMNSVKAKNAFDW